MDRVLSSLSLAREPPLKDHGRRSAIDVLAPDTSLPLTARAPRLQGGTRLERRPTLIDHADGNTKSLFELGGELACGWRERARAAVRIIRGTHHQHAWT
jgi:hypothetical protein